MKIISIDLIKCKRMDFCAQTPVLCRINTDEGIYGYGEAGVSIGDYTLGAYELLKLFGKMLIGSDPLSIDVIYDKLVSTFWAQGNGSVIMSAISAIDLALWDIKAKFFNVPLYVLLGGKHRNKLRTYASQIQNGWKYRDFLNAPGDIEFLKDACSKVKEEGYTCVKIDLTSKWEDGRPISRNELQNHISKAMMRLFEKRLQVVRDIMGQDVDIIIENHNRTSGNTAIQLGQMAENYDIMFMEEPANPLSPIEYKRICDQISIPLATGERVYTRWGFLPLLENGSTAVLQPDLGNCGGITEGRKISDMAQTFGVSIQTHTCNTPISLAASLHFEAAIPNFIIHEHHTVNALSETTELCVYNYQPVDGCFDIPELPGIGNELSEKALREAEIETIR